jgi:hypothetical protein
MGGVSTSASVGDADGANLCGLGRVCHIVVASWARCRVGELERRPPQACIGIASLTNLFIWCVRLAEDQGIVEAHMGSFVELELAFAFLPETPPLVLAAFAAYRTSAPAPSLTTLEEALGEGECQRLRVEVEDYLSAEDMDALPLTHRALVWRSLVAWGQTAYLPGPTYTTMHWDAQDQVWSLATRTQPKSTVGDVEAMVGPLGLFASDGSERWPSEVGRISPEEGLDATIWSIGASPFRIA